MKPDDIERWLTPEQLGLHEHALDIMQSTTDDEWETFNHYSRIKTALESLARRAELLDKHQWVPSLIDESYVCASCGKTKDEGHAPGCAIAAELDGLPRGG